VKKATDPGTPGHAALKCGMYRFLGSALRSLKRLCRDDYEVHRGVTNCGIDSFPVQLARVVYDVVERITHIRDPFEKEKERSNKIALEILSHLEKTILSEDHPLSFFVLTSVLANQIDMGAYNVDLAQLEQRFLHSLYHSAFFIDRFQEFECALRKGKTLLYILDNAGEVVFDLVFMKEIKKKYPQIVISAAYRSKPMINDVTEKDLASIEPILREGIHFFDSGSPYTPESYSPRSAKPSKTVLNTATSSSPKGRATWKDCSPSANPLCTSD